MGPWKIFTRRVWTRIRTSLNTSCSEVYAINGSNRNEDNFPPRGTVTENKANTTIPRQKGGKIRMEDSFWTVLYRTNAPLKRLFVPPKPFSNRLSKLKSNRRIKATYIPATARPWWLREGYDNNEKRNGYGVEPTKRNGDVGMVRGIDALGGIKLL